MCKAYFEMCTDLPMCMMHVCLNNLHDKCMCGYAHGITPNSSKCSKIILEGPCYLVIM